MLQLWALPESYRKTHIWKTKIGDIISEENFYLDTAVACHYLGYQIVLNYFAAEASNSVKAK